MHIINNVDDLKELLSTEKRFHLYGAGSQTINFLSDLKSCGISANITDILVTDINGNPSSLHNIPVVQCDKSALDKQDCILLTLNNVLQNKIADYLNDCEADVINPLPAIYSDVYNSIKAFVAHYPDNLTGLNTPNTKYPGKIVWTCWWQGEDNAPDIVKACWQSQRKHLSDDIQHIIITQNNYSDYITIPDYILEKFKDGKNGLSYLADYIRASLLYKYGGVWLDSTVLLLEPLPKECWELPLYTWRLDAAQFCSQTIWCAWFLAAQQESALFRFVMEAFLFYFSKYDKIKYYLTIDYFISICTNTVSGVLEDFQQIPYNNATAANLERHLHEPYSESQFQQYCKGSFLQKLNRYLSVECSKDSILNHIIRENLR